MFTNILDMKCGFENGKSIFLTYKGEGKHQKMDTIIKHCKKISSTFFVVQEKNKATPGFHYHGLLKLKEQKLPPKRWFRKGVHMHIIEICPSNPNANIPIYDTKHDIEKYKEQILLESKTELEKILNLNRLKLKIDQQKCLTNKININKKVKKLNEINKILQYMNKEIENPKQYINYYLQIRNKSHLIRPNLTRN